MALNFQNSTPAPSGKLPLVIVLLLSLLCVGVYIGEGQAGPLHSVQSAVGGAIAPLQQIASPLGSATEDVAESVDDANADEETLSALREQNAQLTEMLTQAEEYRLEAQRLEELLEIRDVYDIDGVAGRVIGRTTDAWNQTITLDVGSNDGVESGLTVMGSSGVIGQVVSVTAGSCRVRLLTDPQSGAAALIQSSRAEGIVRGSLDGLLHLENIGADVNVQVGDVVLTSGLGGSYTRGLLIGTVARVEGSAGNDSRTIIVAPTGSISVLEEAIVVFSAASDSADRTAPVDDEADTADAEGDGTSGDDSTSGDDETTGEDSQDDASQDSSGNDSDSDGEGA